MTIQTNIQKIDFKYNNIENNLFIFFFFFINLLHEFKIIKIIIVNKKTMDKITVRFNAVNINFYCDKNHEQEIFVTI
jgi:hypothetical protein